MAKLNPHEISRRRVIERISLERGKGSVVANGKTFSITFDDMVDLVQAVEMIMLKLTGKVLNPKFRPQIKSRDGLAISKLVCGDLGKCEGEIPAGISAEHFYLLVEIDGNQWENWFTRLDELIKMLYIIVKEAVGDEYKPAPRIWMGSSSACA